MRFFIDTANVEDIRKANDMGVICGVTTNPSLIAKEGRVFEEVIAEIASIVDGPISGDHYRGLQPHPGFHQPAQLPVCRLYPDKLEKSWRTYFR